MKSESRRIESRTATAVTRRISTNAANAGIRSQSACAAKNVAKRIAMPAASSAFAVTDSVARRLQLAGDEQPDADEEADRHANRGLQPAVLDRIAQEEDAAKGSATAAIQEKSLTPMRLSQSNPGA